MRWRSMYIVEDLFVKIGRSKTNFFYNSFHVALLLGAVDSVAKKKVTKGAEVTSRRTQLSESIKKR